MKHLLILIQFALFSIGINGQSFNEILESTDRDGWIDFHANLRAPPSEIFEKYKSVFDLKEDDQMLLTKKEDDTYGFIHHRYQQVYKEVEVEGAEFILHSKQNVTLKGNGNIISGLNIDMKPKIDTAEAIDLAKKHMNAKLFMWEDDASEQRLKSFQNDISATYFPNPILIITSPENNKNNNNEYQLAYKVDIHSKLPFDGKSIYIDAHNGEVIKVLPLYLNCTPGDGCTLYNGPSLQEIDTDLDGSEYRLFDDCRGDGIHTRKFPWIEEIVDDNNEWVSASQCAGVSAHWAIERTFDYFLEKHSRNSFDNAGAVINAFTESNEFGVDNAFWDRSYLTINFGEGGGGSTTGDVVCLDIVGHEFGHAVTQSACTLDVVGEPGALNESFGDIFGTAVEFFENGVEGNYLIGEDVWIEDGYLRNMKNPKAKFGDPSPDTYLGEYWYEQDYTHNRGGVQNFWFYLLSEGSEMTDGINDNGEIYNMSGIGIEDAIAIVYRSLTVYLTTSSDYLDARYGSIEAAIDIFGECSFEAMEVAAAWDAVGVYDDAICQKHLTLPQIPISTNEYQAKNCISSSGMVENSTNVIMNAGWSVYLKPGFVADLGADFHAFIEGCDLGGNRTSFQDGDESIMSNTISKEILGFKQTANINNYPNPSTGFLNFEFEITNSSLITLEVFDISGNLVATPIKNEEYNIGVHSLPFDGDFLMEGIYFYRFSNEQDIVIKKMILSR